MKLADRTVTDFSDLLASGAPAPGGGSAAALEAALGAGLIAMVCRLTVDKERFAPHREDLLAIQERSEVLRQKLLEGMERDTDAFLQVSGALALELAAEALELAASLAGRFNESAASDLGVAVFSLQTGLRGAWLNVCINVGSLRSGALARSCRERGEALLSRALPLAERTAGQIEQLIQA